MEKKKTSLRIRRKKRIRTKIKGSSDRPRLCVFRSLKNIYVQLIDDDRGVTLIAAKLSDIKNAKNNIEGASQLGKLVAQKCQEAKISKIVFDRSGYKYHGKIKALAEAARKGGLIF